MNILTSFVVTLITLFVDFLVEFKSSILFALFIGALVLSFNPAHAAVIQNSVSDTSMLATSFSEWWSLLVWTKKAALVLFFSGLIIGNFLMWHDRKVTNERIKKEEQEWVKKYCS